MDPINPGFAASAARDPNRALIGAKPVFTHPVTIASGQNLAAGALIGKVTSGGAYKLSVVGAGDGSETPVAVLAEAINASAGAKTGLAYFAGDFNDARLTYGDSHTKDTVWLALAARGIYLESPQAY